MKIAVTAEASQGLDSPVAQHFGRAPYFVLAEIEDGTILSTESIANPFARGHEPGQVPDLIGQYRVSVILSGGMGGRAIERFRELGIETVTGAHGNVRESLERYLGGLLTTAAPCAESVTHGHR